MNPSSTLPVGTPSRPNTPPEMSNSHLLHGLRTALKRPLDFVLAAREKYGDIYTLNIANQRVVVVNHPDQVQHILRDHASNYAKRGKMWDMMRQLFGNGLLVSEGDFWMRQRRMMQPQFHKQRLATLTDMMNESMTDIFSRWQVSAEGSPMELLQAFGEITMRVIVRTMFGAGIHPNEVDRIGEGFRRVTSYMMAGVIANAMPAWLAAPFNHQYRKICRTVDDTVAEIVVRSRAAMQHGNYDDHLISMMLAMVDDDTGASMTDQQVRDEAVNLFIAGYETTANSLAWALDLLLRHPAALQKLKAEVRGAGMRGAVTFEELHSLPYTRQVICETLRLRPPVWWLPRVALADDEMSGYHIPAGTNVACMFYASHQHPAVWEQPQEFMPERFEPERMAQQHPFAWVPFGAGQRLCIGRDFALLESQLLLTLLFRQFDIEPLSAQLATPQPISTLRPRGGVWARVRRLI